MSTMSQLRIKLANEIRKEIERSGWIMVCLYEPNPFWTAQSEFEMEYKSRKMIVRAEDVLWDDERSVLVTKGVGTDELVLPYFRMMNGIWTDDGWFLMNKETAVHTRIVALRPVKVING